jgi:hypothetical protein
VNIDDSGAVKIILMLCQSLICVAKVAKKSPALFQPTAARWLKKRAFGLTTDRLS